MSGNSNKGMEMACEVQPRVAVVGGIVGNVGQEVGVWQELG